MKLATKLAVLLLAAVAVVFGLFGYWNLRLQRHNSEELLVQSADRVSDIILRATQYQMLRNDREALYQTIRDIGQEPGIRRIRVFSKAGGISFSTQPDEIGQIVDKRAEACYACHARSLPLSKLNRPDRARIFTDGGERLLAVIRPIYNQPQCSDNACHAHSPAQQVLGVIDAQLSLTTVDAQLAANQEMLTVFTLAATLSILSASVLFIWMVVHRPIGELKAGIERVARGNLELRLPVRSRDELGDVARSFNQMTSDLQAARREVEQWARTLEERVERKTREVEMAHKSLLHSEKLASVGKLAATVAHEINNPLFGILTCARLGLRHVEHLPVPPEDRTRLADRLRMIERESQRCGEIVNNLLSFSRQSPGKVEPVNLHTVIERSLALVKHQLDLKGIVLRVDLALPHPVIDGDAGRLQQVIVALLVNAIEAMPDGGELAVSAAEEDSAVAVRVRDTGAGIPEDVLPHVFEPFFSTKEGSQKTGLGLAIASNIVEQHGGTIQVHSEPGQGAEFVVRLPISAPLAASGPPSARPASGGATR